MKSAEILRELKRFKKGVSVAGTLLITTTTLSLAIDREATPVSASGDNQWKPPAGLTGTTREPYPTQTPYPTSTPYPTNTPYPTVTPLFTATASPDALATQIADTKKTLDGLIEIQKKLDTLRGPTPAPAPAPVPYGSQPGVIVVPKDVEVVKPEVVKPEIVKVPELIRETVIVPVPATPNPDIISLYEKDFNKFVDERAGKIAEGTVVIAKQTVQAQATSVIATAEAIKKVEPREDRKVEGWHIDVWSALIGGAGGALLTGLIVSLVRPVRVGVIERLERIGGAPPPPP